LEGLYDCECLTNAYYQCIEKMNLMAVITDKAFNIVYANASFCDTTGYSKEEVQGVKPNILKSNEHSVMFYDNLRMTILAGMTWRGTFKNRKKNGSLYWEDASIFPIEVDGERMYVKTAVDVSNRQKMASEKEKDTMLASMIQTSLLPANLYNEDITIKGYYAPYENVSGDIYYWQALNDHQYCVFLADVIGHGVGSALMTTAIIALVTNLMNLNPAPDVVLGELNNRIMDLFKTKDLSQINYFTAAYLLVDTREKMVQFSNCGHPKMYIVSNEGVEDIQEINFPVGLFADVEFSFANYNYTNDMELLIYTDGLIEKDLDKEEEIRVLERLLEKESLSNSSEGLLENVVKDMVISDKEHIKDDVTVISVKLKAGD